MVRNRHRFLFLASVALNTAFVGVWLVHAIPAQWASEQSPSLSAGEGQIWCPLHQKLDVSEAQWRRIEPQLKQFRDFAETACSQVHALRLEMLDLIAGPTPDAAVIAAKQEEILAAQRKVQSLVIGQLLAEKQVLTAKQEAELFALLRARSGCDREGPLMISGPGRGGMGQVLRGDSGDK